MLKMQINSNTTKQMQNIVAKIDTFPNRIASIQQSALHRSGNNLHGKLARKFPAAYYLNYEISISGNLGYRMTITPDKQARRADGSSAYAAAAVFLRGRKSYTVRAKASRYMKLREGSVPPYPPFLETARIPRMAGRSEEIKREARDEIIKNLEYAIKRFGFGPRGGSGGLEDLRTVRVRNA